MKLHHQKICIPQLPIVLPSPLMVLPGVAHVTNTTSSNQLFSCLIMLLSVEDSEQNSEQEGYK